MLYDRTYMRDPAPHSSRPMIFWILGALVAVFVAQQILEIWFDLPWALQFGALSPHAVKSGKVWTLLSYAGLHGGVFHLVVNALLIFFLGRQLESELGGKRLLQIMLWGALGGAVAWLIVNHRHNASLVGASASAMALLTVFALMHPRRPITLLLFFVLPVMLQPIWLLAIVGGLDVLGLLFREIPGQNYSTVMVGHSAHLGGLAAGWLFHRLVVAKTTPLAAPWSRTREIEPPRWFGKAKRAGLNEAPYKIDVRTADELRAEVDRILDKINSDGFGSLTPDEKARLDEARDLLSRR